MVFGVFDGLHKGHHVFLNQAKRCGTYLIVAVTRDHNVRKLKGRLPKKGFRVRVRHLKKVDGVDKVVGGDKALSTYGVLRKYKPDIVVIGYDQRVFKRDLEKHIRRTGLKIKLKIARPYKPKTHHSSLLRGVS